MPIIKLPDGKNLNFPKKVTGLEIAEKISKSLSKQALIISVDGQLKDLSHSIEKDCSIRIFTSKDNEGLETIRHDTAHILAICFFFDSMRFLLSESSISAPIPSTNLNVVALHR